MDSPEKDGARGVRLQVLIAHAGLSSRRAAESLILSGRVSVNGQVVRELGLRCEPSDRIEVDGKAIQAEERKRHVLLNKPVGYLCTSKDDFGRPLALSLVGASERLYSVGRLDLRSSGLIIFTNDGDFASVLGHPSCGIEKEYLVRTNKRIPPGLPLRFAEGLTVEGVHYRAKRCELLREDRARVVLTEGLNREIRVVFKDFGLRVEELTRVRIGPISIEGLSSGCWRELTEDEIRSLVGSGSGGKGRDDGRRD